LWPEKPSGDYIRIINNLYLVNNYLGIGAAVLNFGEYYLAFGWWGVFIGSFLLGWLARKLWNWYRSDRENPLVIITFVVANSFIYVVISRGYLPQVVMNFFFTVFPCFVIYWLWKRKARRLLAMNREIRHKTEI
jgi:biotin transporter BioY